MEVSKPGKASDVEWQRPVDFQVGGRWREHLTAPSSALHYLLQRWPAERGVEHEEACRVCVAAMGSSAPPEEAREAFVKALLKAGLLHHER